LISWFVGLQPSGERSILLVLRQSHPRLDVMPSAALDPGGIFLVDRRKGVPCDDCKRMGSRTSAPLVAHYRRGN
jgi:hypothetical protein